MDDAIAFLSKGDPLRLEATMELTPLQIWWLYETAHEQIADERRRFVSDVATAAGSFASESGFKAFKEHLALLGSVSSA